ncbi:MAG: histidine phosphatase family protein [Synergistes sp.]|nr:histidine phosphatase family protein [Synergistes sp.]
MALLKIDDMPGLAPQKGGRNIFFVRHGRTQLNGEMRYQGRTDVPLNDEGREQALRTALRFSQSRIDAVICSPLLRACETARIIASHHIGIAAEKNDLFTEFDFGAWEKLTAEEIRTLSGAEYFKKWSAAPLDMEVPGGERLEAFFERCVAASEYLLSRNEENIIVVGHGAMFRGLFLSMLKYDRTSIFWRMRLDNCSITTFGVTANRFMLKRLNDDIHIKIDKNFISCVPVM